ncbi:hypothetical protein ACB094_03G079000 [Castanea mollissima]
MSLFGKVEADVEIKAPAEKFHEIVSCRPHHISSVSPGLIQGCALHEGDWGNEGSVIKWDYVHGDLMEEYKNFKFTVQATPKGEGSLVHWTMEYEKLHENIVEPNTLLQLVLDLSKDLDAHLERK